MAIEKNHLNEFDTQSTIIHTYNGFYAIIRSEGSFFLQRRKFFF